MQVDIREGSILEADTDAIANPADAEGKMEAGLASMITEAAGADIAQQVAAKAPIAVGAAVVTEGGRTRFKAIIHVPTMPVGAASADAKQVGQATRAALKATEDGGFKSVALPGFGTGRGGVSPEVAAAEMFAAIRSFSSSPIERVVLIDTSSDIVAAWTACIDCF
ncbi:MAG: macro domain-containing protein [Candidatus Schekmanbacteria bacterium]|nr:macro domain-containing protein [Candidatus Schekmanbacteria bacterium]